MSTEANDQIRCTHSFRVISSKELVGCSFVSARFRELNNNQQDTFGTVEHRGGIHSRSSEGACGEV